MRRTRKLGDPDTCSARVERVVGEWMDGYGPGSSHAAFPSAAQRIGAGYAILRIAEGCLASNLLEKFRNRLKSEERRARRRDA